MGSEAIDDFPPLKPIKTKTTPAITEEEECVTPKSEDHVLKMPVTCPPAPRKPRPTKRKEMGPTFRNLSFCAVPRDLTSLFLAVPISNSRSEKRIRVS